MEDGMFYIPYGKAVGGTALIKDGDAVTILCSGQRSSSEPMGIEKSALNTEDHDVFPRL